MSKYFDGELLSAYEDLNKEFECKKENVELHKKIADLEIQLSLTEKALELACLSLRNKCDYCKHKDDEICPPDHHCSNLVMEYFLEQAKEMLKDDNN